MTGFVFSPTAKQDLLEIWDYIARDSVDAADRLRDEIYDALGKLTEMPGIGHHREDLGDQTLPGFGLYAHT